jgi:hypothetical protein
MTDPQCNMVLEALTPSVPCPNLVLLSWNSSINMMDTLNGYNILYRKKGIDTEFKVFDFIRGEHFTQIDPAIKIEYEAKYLDTNSFYQFVIQAVSKNDTVGAFSNIVEHQTYYINTEPVEVIITCVSVNKNDNIEISVTTDPFPEPPIKIYLYRDQHDPKNAPVNEGALSFTVIDSTNYNGANSYFFIDKNVNPKTELYYYKVIAKHQCKAPDVSNILTNIFLEGKPAGQFGDSIHFLQIGIPLLNPDEFYDLLRIVYEDEVLIAENLTLLNNSYLIDTKSFANDGIVLKFQIKSKGGCYSNTIVVEHETQVQFPTAFYPGSSYSVNQTFYPIIEFPFEKTSEDKWHILW